MKSSIKWAVFFLIVIIICSVMLMIRHSSSDDAVIAHVIQDGKLIDEIDLSKVREPYEFSVSCESGSNTIRVESGRICVTDADCPDKICIHTGYISDAVTPIVCLPHKLTVTVSGAGRYDAVAGGQ